MEFQTMNECSETVTDRIHSIIEISLTLFVVSVTTMDHTDLPNLASPQLGTQIVFATDEWFAAADNLIKDEPAVWKEDLYTPYGKWMDGWESRRRRTAGHDWCIIKLGIPGVLRAIEVDTAYFTGNFSPKVSIQYQLYESEPKEIAELLRLRAETIQSRPEDGKMGTCATPEEFDLVNRLDSIHWPTLIPLTPLGAGYEATRRNLFVVPSGHGCVTHIRINMGPDGGIARLRLFGEVVFRSDLVPFDRIVDLASIELGGLALLWSNKHYGHPRNLIVPGRGNCMGDGWETARQPLRPAVYEIGFDGLIVLPGCDWAILKLGLPGTVSNIEVDTNFYKGNYPESCMIEACYLPNATTDIFHKSAENIQIEWTLLLPRTKLHPGTQHVFTVLNVGPISHIRLTIFPDGGVMRLRVNGRKCPESKL